MGRQVRCLDFPPCAHLPFFQPQSTRAGLATPPVPPGLERSHCVQVFKQKLNRSGRKRASARKRIDEFRTSGIKGEQQERGQRKRGSVGRADTCSVMLTLVRSKLYPNAECGEKENLRFSGSSSHNQTFLQGLISLWFSSVPSALLVASPGNVSSVSSSLLGSETLCVFSP